MSLDATTFPTMDLFSDLTSFKTHNIHKQYVHIETHYSLLKGFRTTRLIAEKVH
jgi:hypothetical protein